MSITPPTTVIASFIRHPLVLPDGRTVYAIETDAGCFVAVRQPDVVDAGGQPITLAAELGPGAIVRAAVVEGLLRNVQVIRAAYRNPFGDPE